MKKMLVVNVCNPLSYGGMAITIGLINALRKCIPDANVIFMSTRFEVDHKLYEKYGLGHIKLIRHAWYREKSSILKTLVYSIIPALVTLLNCFVSRIFLKFNVSRKNVYQESDLVIDLNSDSLNEYYGITFPLFALFNVILAILAGKPVVICPMSIGPFQNRFLKFLVKFILNRTSLITAREEISRNYLRTLGVSNPKIYLTADLAFLLEPAPLERIYEILTKEDLSRHNEPLIGIVASQLIHRYGFPGCPDLKMKYWKYVELMAEVANYLVEELNATVVLIPFSVKPNEDDRVACKKIYQKVRNRQKVNLITADYTAAEIKGIIKMCDMLIACRMHSTIASTSMGVPTIAVAYSHKFHGIIGSMMGQEKFIVDFNSDFNELLLDIKLKIKQVWENKGLIKDELEEKTKRVQELALFNGLLIKDLLGS